MFTPDSSETFLDMDAVKLNDKIYAWATGSNGRILKLVDTAIAIGIKNSGGCPIPDGYELEQNYPNPFNPRCIIKYSIPKSCNVTIKVFNIQGKEVAVLINNVYKASGKYEIEFNGYNLPSGVYFYKFEVKGTLNKSFVEAKKMVLVK
jgi:hypothetical protein